MIRSFSSKALSQFAATGDAAKLPVQNDARVRQILALLEAALTPTAMNLPGLVFHSLKGKPKRYAVRVTGNYRITFGWNGDDAIGVDIEDYH